MFRIFAYFLTFVILIYFFPANSQSLGQSTGLKIPRYVSLKSNDSNIRIGSSKNYPIILKYILKNIPLEITDEYGNWRKVIDFEKNEGWLHSSLIKAERFGIIFSPYEESVQVLKKPEGRVIGKIGKRNVVKIERCLKKWCLISINKNKGWISKINLWGVYEDEIINIPFYQPLTNQLWKLN